MGDRRLEEIQQLNGVNKTSADSCEASHEAHRGSSPDSNRVFGEDLWGDEH